jgi:hypothetical protein
MVVCSPVVMAGAGHDGESEAGRPNYSPPRAYPDTCGDTPRSRGHSPAMTNRRESWRHGGLVSQLPGELILDKLPNSSRSSCPQPIEEATDLGGHPLRLTGHVLGGGKHVACPLSGFSRIAPDLLDFACDLGGPRGCLLYIPCDLPGGRTLLLDRCRDRRGNMADLPDGIPRSRQNAKILG